MTSTLPQTDKPVKYTASEAEAKPSEDPMNGEKHGCTSASTVGKPFAPGPRPEIRSFASVQNLHRGFWAAGDSAKEHDRKTGLVDRLDPRNIDPKKHIKDLGHLAMGGVSKGEKLAIGFRDFLMRGNVVDLAVAVVVGAAFADLVKSFTSSFLTPLIAAIWGGLDFSTLYFTVHNSRFTYGAFINAALTFIITCAVIYCFVVVPMGALINNFFPKVPKLTCKECLEEIHAGATRCPHCCIQIPPAPPKTAEEELADLRAAQRAPPGGLQRHVTGEDLSSPAGSQRLPKESLSTAVSNTMLSRPSAQRRQAAAAAAAAEPQKTPPAPLRTTYAAKGPDKV